MRYRVITDAIIDVLPTYVCNIVINIKDIDRRTYDAKQIAYRAWCRARNDEHWGHFVLAHAEAQTVYGAARE